MASCGSTLTVTITFRTPARENPPVASCVHERTLEAVPPAAAQQMMEDFAQYRRANALPDPTASAPASSGSADHGRSKIYRYDCPDGEVIIALDFREILALVATP
jgi:hypothetical protein